MLDQVISFGDQLRAQVVNIRLDKASGRLIISADKAPGVEFSVADLRSSTGGILNDNTATRILNDQLRGARQ